MSAYFSKDLFAFLRELEQNNNRDWFHEQKHRYEALVKEPLIAFLADLDGQLEAGYEVSSKAILRQHRDTRFSQNKAPYKTSVACFMHSTSMKKSDHPHGYYLHLSDEECFFGAGVHSPPSASLLKIRKRIIESPNEWAPISKLKLSGNSLKRPPKGFSADETYINDLKRKDYLISTQLTQSEVTSQKLLKTYLDHCRQSRPLMNFLSQSLA